MKINIIIVLFLLSTVKVFTQETFFEKFNFEATANYSTFLNKSNLDSINFWLPIAVYEENNLWKFNYNLSIGYEFSQHYNLRLKYSRLNIHRNISGATYNIGGDDSCCYPTYWTDFNDEIVNTSFSIINEFNVNLSKFKLLGTIELAKQTFDRGNTVFYLQGMKKNNYALAYSIGIQKFISKHFSSVLRIISTNAIFGKDEYAKDVNTGSFLPVTYGVELGFRFQMTKT